MLGRYSSEIRTGCANERPSGSARGAISDGRPYRDHQLLSGREVGFQVRRKPSRTTHVLVTYNVSLKKAQRR